ncbi:conserved hypothetical protein [Ricinus communis]|uniref:Reverse transcriptase zinc-binding domain-containing protein n=1 Tax=Ricinus communis TaxID=3988 RepID=B9RCB2_RICCO|nr:conserved hypothetical protein [Ricinus communis]
MSFSNNVDDNRRRPLCNFLGVEGMGQLKIGVRWRVGNGRNISVWNDGWLPGTAPFMVGQGTGDLSRDALVRDLLLDGGRRWNNELIVEKFSRDDADSIMGIPLSINPGQDKLIWHYSSKVWSQIWRLAIPPKLKHFMWRFVRGILPTRELLFKRTGLGTNICERCGASDENADHIFVHFRWVRCIWFGSVLGLNTQGFENSSIVDWFLSMLNTMDEDGLSLANSNQLDKTLHCDSELEGSKGKWHIY